MGLLYSLDPVFTQIFVRLVSAVGEDVQRILRTAAFDTLLLQRFEFFDRHRCVRAGGGDRGNSGAVALVCMLCGGRRGLMVRAVPGPSRVSRPRHASPVRRSSDLTSLLATDLDAVRSLVVANAARDRGIRAALEAVGCVGILAWQSRLLGPILVGLGMATAATAFVYRRQTRSVERLYSAAHVSMAGAAEEAFTNIRCVARSPCGGLGVVLGVGGLGTVQVGCCKVQRQARLHSCSARGAGVGAAVVCRRRCELGLVC